MAALTAAAVMATVTIEVNRSPIVTSLVSWLLDNLFFEHLSCCVLDCIPVQLAGKCWIGTSVRPAWIARRHHGQRWAAEQKRPLVGEQRPRLERWRDGSTCPT